MILPPVRLPDKAYLSTWLGLTSRQSNAAFYMAAAQDGDAMVEAFKRVQAAALEMEAALTEFRGCLLTRTGGTTPRLPGAS